ncbi:MAG: NAD(+) synthase, partial [Clostridia bacterium]|nr:NAD(+) synthase [Clostridia bacterium]
MKHGFIKVAAASPRVIVADTDANANEIIAVCRRASDAGAKLLVLPELCVTAYTCGDLFLHKALLDAAERAVLRIAEETAELDMAIVIGAPLRCGQKLYNCAVVLHRGRILGAVPKSNIPNYSEFYELRHFTPAPEEMREVKLGGECVPLGTDLLFGCRALPAFTFACEICEDLWVPV